MTGFFADKKRTLSAVLTVIFAISFCAVAACIIAAAPRDDDFEPQITVSGEPSKILSPDTAEDSSLPDFEETTQKTEDTDATDTTESTTSLEEVKLSPADEPLETQPTITVDEDPDEFIVDEPDLSDYEIFFEETEETEELTPPDGPMYVIPELKDGYLVEDLGVDYSIKTPKFEITEEELVLAATVIQLEVMGDGSRLYAFEDIPEKYWEMCAVAQCIRNRVESSMFPSTVWDVITQSTTYPNGYVIYQFSPAEKLALYTPTEDALLAAYEVLVEGVSVVPQNYYYFCATYICEYFEEGNAYMFAYNADGSIIKTEGHLTTFYAGRK